MHIELVKDLGGVWSRPFVVDGDPFDIDIAIIGLNPATAIQTKELSQEDFHDLLLERASFETWYEAQRQKSGNNNNKVSRTRQRLRLLTCGYNGAKITETNVNALPTRNEHELKKHPCVSEGELIAKSYLKSIQPTLVITHGKILLISYSRMTTFPMRVIASQTVL